MPALRSCLSISFSILVLIYVLHWLLAFPWLWMIGYLVVGAIFVGFSTWLYSGMYSEDE